MRLVVIGGVAAGLSAAARARRLDPSLDILVLEKGETIAYGACGLPYYVEGRVRRAAELVVYTAEYFRKERNIEVRTGASVASIAHAKRELGLAGGERVRYDRLVVATGARADRSLAGAEQAHVFTLHTLADAERLRAFLREAKPHRAVVVGAGYIGLEAADTLRRRGLEVTIVSRDSDVLGREDPELT
ncbi:MAG: NAD(P)/FAD-dependent oxidoreductase, partial [Bryobacteraceae bacterium]